MHVYPVRRVFVTNSQNDLLQVGLTAQLLEDYTGIAEFMGSIPVLRMDFFRLSFVTAEVALITAVNLKS